MDTDSLCKMDRNCWILTKARKLTFRNHSRIFNRYNKINTILSSFIKEAIVTTKMIRLIIITMKVMLAEALWMAKISLRRVCKNLEKLRNPELFWTPDLPPLERLILIIKILNLISNLNRPCSPLVATKSRIKISLISLHRWLCHLTKANKQPNKPQTR
jgi:hypothetical protein